jgi:hypothetical protein
VVVIERRSLSVGSELFPLLNLSPGLYSLLRQLLPRRSPGEKRHL